ncbi:MAG: DUF547 domain-containing protein [Myxococcota bacterium]
MDLELYGALLERYTVAVDDIASTRVDYGALAKSADWIGSCAVSRAIRDSWRRARRSSPSGSTPTTSSRSRSCGGTDPTTASVRSEVRSRRPKRPAGSIGGRDHTLDEIEHRILRPMGEPRIHAAIVCASNSCPPLRREPYRADRLDAQLDDNVGRWLADPRKGARVDRAAKTLWLSPILDWFEEDFREGVVPFVARHAPPPVAEWIREQGPALRIRHFDYDWSLNDTRASSQPGAQSRLDRSPGPETRPDRRGPPPAGPGAGSRT